MALASLLSYSPLPKMETDAPCLGANGDVGTSVNCSFSLLLPNCCTSYLISPMSRFFSGSTVLVLRFLFAKFVSVTEWLGSTA